MNYLKSKKITKVKEDVSGYSSCTNCMVSCGSSCGWGCTGGCASYCTFTCSGSNWLF